MIRHAGANMETVRKRNRATILKFINDSGPVSRKDLADVTGLTPAAVTQICTDLLQEGILVETGMDAENQGAGRKKILLDIDYDYAYVFAINIEPEYSVVALSNLCGNMVAYDRCKTDTGVAPEVFLNRLAQTCQKMKTEHPKIAQKVIAVGVGITGIVDKTNGVSKKAYGIWGSEVAVGDLLSKAMDLPVYVENNVNAFARAELFYGTGRQHDNLMVIKWGPGVGCAMIIDQEVYEGRHHKAAELGHFIVDPQGERCRCGRRGCLETIISYQALNKIVPFEQKDFGAVYLEHRAQGFDEAIDIFARSIVNSATIMAPNRIIITGALFQGAEIREALIQACGRYDATWKEQRVLYSELSDREGYIGPVAICAKQILF